MKKIKTHFKFNKQERSGIFFLLLIIILIQVGYVVYRSHPFRRSVSSFSEDSELQSKIDVLKASSLRKNSTKVFPFNPNFITDFKGYTLGMSVLEIDRLHTFRANNEYINTPQDFQKVTHVSDSLLQIISPYFKFPEWTKKKKQAVVARNHYQSSAKASEVSNRSSTGIEIRDINKAMAADLRGVNGVGPVLSKRIIKFRNRLGGFLIDEQLSDVYGLEPAVVARVLRKFKVFNQPLVQKTNINSASADEISSLVYISYGVAEEMVRYRVENGSYTTLNELNNIPGFPTEKIDRIALYLSL